MNESRSQYSWLWAIHHVALCVWVCDRHPKLFSASLLKCFLQSDDQISSCSCKESLDARFIQDTQTSDASFLNIYKLFITAKAKEKRHVKEWKWSLALYEAGKTFVKPEDNISDSRVTTALLSWRGRTAHPSASVLHRCDPQPLQSCRSTQTTCVQFS